MDANSKDVAPQLGRTLGALDVTLLGIGAIVGGGIFASIGTAAVGDAQRPGAGPSLMVSLLLTALCCLLTAVCYSELAALLPSAGSAYAYARRAFGTRLGWLIGWCLTLEYAVANVAVAISFGDYAAALLAPALQPVLDPWHLQLSPRGLGAAFVLALSLALVRGTRESSRLNDLLVAFKVLVLLFFVGLGLWASSPATLWHNWHPFMPQGMRGTLYGSAVIFFAFIGFDSVATVAEEVVEPQRNIPLGICASLGICALLYIAVAAIITGVVPLPTLAARLATASSQPLTVVLDLLGPRAKWATPLIAIGALVAQSTALLAFQLAQARIFFAMARDGQLPAALARVHPRYHTPHVATLWAGALVAGGTLCFRIETMFDLTDIGTLFIFCITNASLPVLRRRLPALPRPFKVPLGPYVCPLLGVGCCVTLMLCLPRLAWLSLFGWLLVGATVQSLVAARRAPA